MNIWAVIPMKPIRLAKSRLSGILTQEERQQLVMSLFSHTLSELKASNVLNGILVVSADPIYQNYCDQKHVHFLQEIKTAGLNASINLAAEALLKRHADAMLVIHGDLPLLNQADLIPLIEQTPSPGVGLVMDRHQAGTNILFTVPPKVIPFCFGENSLIKHQEAARECNIPTHTILSESLSLDIDTPEDLLFYKELTAFGYQL